ncbi:hypothetical protein MTO96_000456 [Rhipicephalus appendiculatus]
MAKTPAAPTRAPTASHARSKALKTPLNKTTRPKTDQKAQPVTSALDQADMECQDSDAGDCITHQDNEGNAWNIWRQEAVVNACQGKITDSQFLLRLKPGSNIFIISTPDQDVADITRKITGLTLNGRLHAVNAYAAVGDGTRKGGAGDSRELDPATNEQGGGDGTRGNPCNISP